MVKASIFALLCAVVSAKFSLALVFPGLIILPLLEAAYMFFHHGQVLDGVIAGCLFLYVVEAVGYFGTVLFVLSGHRASVGN